MIVGSDGDIYIDNGHAAYPHLTDFLTSCCEPVCRTLHMSEYRLSPSSLSAASAEGTYSTAMIRNVIRYFRLDDDHRLPVDLSKFTALEQQLHSETVEDVVTMKRPREEDPPSPTKPDDNKEAIDGVKCKKEDDSGEAVRSPVEELPRRRILSLARRPIRCDAPEPLVARALQYPDALQPLPPNLELMLAEEESSSKVRIVLQPRLRSFQQQQQQQQQQQSDNEEEMGLAYFLVSPDRQHMEFLVSRLQEYLVPITLHGAQRWVLSDVDRGVEEKSVVESGRSLILRRLFDVPENSKGNSNNGGNESPSGSVAGEGRQYSRIVYKSQVQNGRLRNVRERLYKELSVRADLFYDYGQDRTLHVPNLTLAEHVRLRPYQTASLERFRRGNKAHQGVVVLPCGAGKTLTGIGAASIVKKRTIIMCINVMSVLQWQREFLRWTNLREEQVTICVSDKKQMPGDVFITTYNMLVVRRNTDGTGDQEQSEDAKLTSRVLAAASEQPWGLLVLDEVHTALAKHFQEVLNKVKYKCVVGLSATLLREDDKINDLRHLVGPKLYEANWLELTRAGFLARVECAEVQCPMPLPFFSEYLRHTDDVNGMASSSFVNPMARAVVCFNPFKLWCAQALLEFHRNRSPPDKVIIFCDDIEGVHFYARHLRIPLMDGRTGETERANLLQYFQYSPDVNAIILSRVGDVALDLPCASVIIQISGLGASRRQEAQRLGRILRPKPPSLDNTCSFFYTLVSQDTHEVRQSYDRQSWLRDQGFAYRVLRADAILREMRRLGVRRCCVGAPRWWYEAQPRGGGVPLGGPGHWVPFGREASYRIDHQFVMGRDGCQLSAASLAGTPRPEGFDGNGGGAGESWTVRFSAANAPETFGTVELCEGRPDLVRRICVGWRDEAHDCLHGEDCMQYALERMRHTVERRAKKQ